MLFPYNAFTGLEVIKMKKCKGSFTLEATIVISSLIMVLFAVIYAFLLIYQNVVIANAASYAAQRGSQIWVEDRSDSDRYWRTKEFGIITSGTQVNTIKELANNRLKTGAMSISSNDIKVEFSNSWGMRKISVEIKKKIDIPFGGIVEYFNGGMPLELKAKSTANVAEPTEYIRNIDYAREWMCTLGEWIKEKAGDTDLGKQISELFG